ncbi:MAG: TIM barrel protein, partial [Planctomycetales bacterium]|nr:TIM barrel protein [Planctomycetales bacterium]
MPPRIAAFPKCYLDDIAGTRTMSVFDWIEMARSLDADGLEMYEGFFTSLDEDYLDRVGEAISEEGFAMPMLCCSPDFTHPDPAFRQRQIDLEKGWIDMAIGLGAGYCRVLSGQRRPEVSRDEGIRYAAESIEA